MNDDPTTDRWTSASLLAGGVLILVGGLAGGMMMGAWGGMGAMMGGYASYMTTTWLGGMAWWMGVIGVLTGGLVLYAAYRSRVTPHDRALVGTLGIVGGALSFLAMGGWVLGGVLAIVGGALALAGSRPSSDPPAKGASR